MPATLRLKPFIPSIHASLMVETTQGTVPLSRTAEYAALMQAGVVDAAGTVDEMVRDWFTVLGRPDREVVLSIRRPALRSDSAARVTEERVMVISQHRRWMAMAARDGNEMVVGPVGESDDAAERVEMMCQTLILALGEAEPADIEGANVLADMVQAVMDNAAPHGPAAISAGLARLGLAPATVEAMAATQQLDSSAMAVMTILDHGRTLHAVPRVLTVADTDLGRLTFSTSTGADGKKWLSIWPGTVAGIHDDMVELLSTPVGVGA
ncbi:ESX secretion-associated protein EspG, partial [Mycolicibacterium sp. P1-18]|uniref:ESX secretion-associated protein EspG n=1 Tax=Mycolicibacterium sp. P1-18 TaxID=2024615 RepID=UPI0011F36185